MFPFSAMPMFSDAPRRLCVFHVTEPGGGAIDPSRMFAQASDFANPTPRIGIRLPERLLYGTELLSDDEVTARVHRYMAGAQSGLPYLTVQQDIFGPVRLGGRETVGILASRQWRVTAAAPE